MTERNRTLLGTRLIAPDVDVSGIPDLYTESKVRSKKKMQRLLEVRTLFYVQKLSAKEIAEKLKMTERTVYKHLVTLREIATEVVSSDAGLVADINKFLWTIMGSYEERIKKLWEHHNTATTPSIKTDILKEIAGQEKQYVLTLQSLGYLPKVADKKYSASVTYISHLGKEKLTKVKEKSTVIKNGEVNRVKNEMEEAKDEKE